MACLLLGGCSPGAEYPSLFPAVHDVPPPRNDAPMNPLEVQKATEDLITERDRLNAQAPQNAPAKGTADAAKDKATGSGAAAKTTMSKAAAQGARQQTAAAPPATTASAQGAGMQAAGADPKP